MPINQKVINRKINLINKDLKNLTQIGKIPLAKYLDSDDYEALAERYLERVIGRMIDINYHILSEAENHVSLDYYNSFIDLGKKRYLPKSLSKSLANAAGLRNRLAHEYDEIDEKQVYHAVKRCLKEVPEYLDYIIKFLDKLSRRKRLIEPCGKN